MSNIEIILEGPDLASRTLAATERLKIGQLVTNGNLVIIDLSNVLTVSDSYADELFGVLAAVHGLEWVTKNLGFYGARENVLRSIAVAIKRRLEESDQPITLSA